MYVKYIAHFVSIGNFVESKIIVNSPSRENYYAGKNQQFDSN